MGEISQDKTRILIHFSVLKEHDLMRGSPKQGLSLCKVTVGP